MKILYIRHGSPSYDPNCLTLRGHYEAEQTAKFLNTYDVKKIISSDSNRAFQTASYLSKLNGLEIEQIHSISEDITGEYFGSVENGKFEWLFFSEKFRDIIQKNDTNKEWFKEEAFKNTKFYEGYTTIKKSCDDLLRSINIEHNHKTNEFKAIGEVPDTVAIFAHGGMGMIFIPSLLDINLMHFVNAYQQLQTCGVVEIDIDLEKTHKAKIKKYNQIFYDIIKDQEVPNVLPDIK